MATSGSLSMTASQLTTYPNKKAGVVWLALGGASLSKAMLTEGIAVGDVLYGSAATVCLLSALKSERVLYMPVWSLYVGFFIIWAAIGGLLASGYSSLPFSETEFWRSFAKLIFYGIGAILIGHYVRLIEANTMGKAVFNILTLHSLLALYIYAAQLLKQSSSIDLPYEFFWFGQGGPLVFGTDLAPRTVGGVVLHKARGIFSEPSTFGIYQTLGLAFLYFRSPTTVLIPTWKHSIILASLLLTFSLSSYVLLLVLLSTWVFRQSQIKRSFLTIRLMIASLLVVFLLSLLSPVRLSEAFQHVILDRLVSLARLEDRTGVARLVASWDVASTVVWHSPVFGSGLGSLEFAFLNSSQAYSSSVAREVLTVTLAGSAAAFNILFAVLGSLGVVGFLFFLLLIRNVVARSACCGLVFLVSMFATGILLGPVFWTYYVLLGTSFLQSSSRP